MQLLKPRQREEINIVFLTVIILDAPNAGSPHELITKGRYADGRLKVADTNPAAQSNLNCYPLYNEQQVDVAASVERNFFFRGGRRERKRTWR